MYSFNNYWRARLCPAFPCVKSYGEGSSARPNYHRGKEASTIILWALYKYRGKCRYGGSHPKPQYLRGLGRRLDVSLRPFCTTWQISGQPRLHNTTVTQRNHDKSKYINKINKYKILPKILRKQYKVPEDGGGGAKLL